MKVHDYSKIGLFKHNVDSYERVDAAYESGEKRVAILQATGTGKTYQALQLAYEHPEKKTIFFAPNNAIIEHIIETINNNPNLDFERDFPNLSFMTYQGLSGMEDEDIKKMKVDLAIFDEFHHLGAPVWGDKVNTLVDSHPDAWLFGMSAYSIRKRGTMYERDMALPGGNEIFSDKVVTNYDLADAMVDGVLPIPTFESTYLDIESRIDRLEKGINNIKNDALKESLKLDLIKIKRLITASNSIQDLLKHVLRHDGKYIYFCPPGKANLKSATEDDSTEFEDEEEENKYSNVARIIDLHVEIMRTILEDMNLIEGLDFTLYKTLSDMPDNGYDERSEFYNDYREILRIMFNINQYGEGVHAPEVTGIIMARATGSDIVAFEQIGRALSAQTYGGKSYSSMTYQDLITEAINRGIDFESIINPELSEEEQRKVLIDRLSSPVIIDLAGNVKFIEELQESIKAKVEKRRQKGGYVSPSALALYNGNFNILSVDNGHINKSIETLKERMKIDKIDEFINEINKGNAKAFFYHSDVLFSNGDRFEYYWSDNKDAIKDALANNPKYKDGYDEARKQIYYKEYYAILDNKVYEFIKLLESGNRKILARLNPYKFENGESMARFYMYHSKDVKEALWHNPRYKNCNLARLFIEEYDYYSVVENKIRYMLDLLNDGHKEVLLYDNGLFFPNGTSMNQYYTMYKTRIHEIVESEPKYANARKYLEEYEFCLIKDNRIRYFIEILNEGNGDILSVKNPYTFPNGVPVSKYWSDANNKRIIKDLLANDPEYKEGYDTARRLIAEYEYNHDPKNKLREFIELINNGHEDALLVVNPYVFKNGSSVSHYYSKFKEDVWDALENNPEYATGYERAKEAIANYEYNNDISYRIHDLIEMLNTFEDPNTVVCLTNANKFKNGGLTAKFWIANRETILTVLLSNPRYETGYERAKAFILEYEQKVGDVAKRKVAHENGIPYESVMDLPISELTAKIWFLRSKKIKPYEDGKLNPIFNMSSKKLEKVYGITYEELISAYVQKWGR